MVTRWVWKVVYEESIGRISCKSGSLDENIEKDQFQLKGFSLKERPRRRCHNGGPVTTSTRRTSRRNSKMSRHNGPVKFYSREEIVRWESKWLESDVVGTQKVQQTSNSLPKRCI